MQPRRGRAPGAGNPLTCQRLFFGVCVSVCIATIDVVSNYLHLFGFACLLVQSKPRMCISHMVGPTLVWNLAWVVQQRMVVAELEGATSSLLAIQLDQSVSIDLGGY